MEDRELPISIEIQKEVYSKKYEEKYGKEKYDEIWKVHVRSRAMFLAEFTSNILLSEFKRRTTMLHYKFEGHDGEDESGPDHKSEKHHHHHHHRYYYKDPPTCIPVRKCIVRTERCDAEGHEFGKCRISKVMSDGTWLFLFTYSE
jgi:hypothetical protein